MRILILILMAAAAASASLVNDGSFENGGCDTGSAWTCVTSEPDCETIVDPVGAWGYPAYDGSLAAWLGGTCDNVGISNSVCQEMLISPAVLSFWWMGWYTLVGEQEASLFITVDGETVYEFPLGPEHHTIGTWAPSEEGFGVLDLRAWEDGDPHMLCIGLNNSYANNGDTTANMLLDYFELKHPVATEATSFSTVKRLY